MVLGLLNVSTVVTLVMTALLPYLCNPDPLCSLMQISSKEQWYPCKTSPHSSRKGEMGGKPCCSAP